MMTSTRFDIPTHLNATEPIEWTKGKRDQVRLMVMKRDNGERYHDQFSNIASYFKKGDLLVFNNSRTIPPVLEGKSPIGEVEIRLSRKLSNHEWEVLIVNPDYHIGLSIHFPGNLKGTIVDYSKNRPLVIMSFNQSGSNLFNAIYQIGKPIRYEYIKKPLPLEAYQTVYGTVPGSVELASAGRAFSWELLTELKRKGIQIAFLSLHAGLSYYEKDRWPSPEEHPEPFNIPKETADLINETKKQGGRVIAVGTTVVRALESAVNKFQTVESMDTVTNLYIYKGFSLKVVDGLLTGLHEPEASHLDMLAAFIKEDFLFAAYEEAIHYNYLWHEFGDMNLILPGGQ
ncbi:S-adenosylmethionine:tRNA ribosyltransferase-isomerase [Salirhabdus euzebyi]|uniref:S-adenosylmethionine:tRNA ribosyltransferase-isomerase n=1 Tax=Salirhabdus euzebyi TaxID=394506 RepID=A0A841Q616_9BACI|nr:S-adenosylmethionine:tRNA ribosyltransferase-isomerase [Salirhabdus euzebyi]MBB6453850.1 S-adenosylmethionine:tRNA ribosyltransferase-isomerase [Salirhabdus euzebyi]